jgi:flagellar protein FlaF
MNHAANAYARTAKMGQTGRETEASVLLNAAARLQTIIDNWDERQGELGDALTYNRRVWTILSTGATAEENQLPIGVKESIMNLSVFIFKRTFDLMFEPSAQKLHVLVSINRNIAAGLRASPVAAAPSEQAA